MFLDSKSTKTQNAIKTWTKALSGNRRSGLQSAERDRVLFYWESANSTHLAATRLREVFPEHKNSDTSSKYFTIYYVLVCIPPYRVQDEVVAEVSTKVLVEVRGTIMTEVWEEFDLVAHGHSYSWPPTPISSHPRQRPNLNSGVEPTQHDKPTPGLKSGPRPRPPMAAHAYNLPCPRSYPQPAAHAHGRPCLWPTWPTACAPPSRPALSTASLVRGLRTCPLMAAHTH